MDLVCMARRAAQSGRRIFCQLASPRCGASAVLSIAAALSAQPLPQPFVPQPFRRSPLRRSPIYGRVAASSRLRRIPLAAALSP
mmetsp:Transcript_37955/g.88833  ORF Transcript_37955/g.88833 Transcript_37955/m.88833 type:complete len:84 (+) Transcript_37955:113-364(+)